MNILVIGKFYPEGFGLHIAETLERMTHTVVRFDPDLPESPAGRIFGHRMGRVLGALRVASDQMPALRARRMRALWRRVEAQPLDVIIVCHDFLWPREVTELKRRSGAQIALWFPDGIANFGRGLFMNAPYDALFFKDPYIVRSLGSILPTKVFYLPECFNVQKHWLREEDIGSDPQYACDLGIVGNSHAYRIAFFKQLLGYDIKQWGNRPPSWLPTDGLERVHGGRSVINEEKVRAFRGARIVVNNLYYGEIWGVNARAFEAAGAGAFQMIDWRPGLAQLFAIGSEIVVFDGMVDLKTKIDFWLPRTEERGVIGAAGMKRAHAEHTYELRLATLLHTLAGNEAGFPLPTISYAS